MDETDATTSNCARCGDPATLVCTGCRIEDPVHGELVAKTKYCSVSCQKEDWPRHKAFCKATRAISKYQSAILQASKLQPSEPQPDDNQTRKPQEPEILSDEVKVPKLQPGQPTPLEPLPNNASHSCVECQSPATHACQICKGAPNSTSGLVPPTYYCSLACQRANHSSHKNACQAAQARRKLYEAGTELQKRYHWYCRAMVTVMVETSTLDGEYKIVYEKDSVPRSINATALLRSMHLDSEEAKVYMACLIGSAHVDATADSVMGHLDDLVLEIHQVDISMRTLRRRFMREDQEALSDKHQVLHIVLKQGEEYALDVSGLQFGLTTPVVPWALYIREHVRQIESSEVFEDGKP